MFRPLCLILAAIVVLPAAAQAQRDRDKCSVASIDPVHTQAGPVYRDCDVDTKASLRREGRVSFDFDRSTSCVFAELEFVVDTAGVPDTTGAMVVLDANNAQFVARVRSAIPGFRFKPAIKDGIAVRQVVRYRKALATQKLPFTVSEVRPGGAVVSGSASGSPARPAPPNCR